MSYMPDNIPKTVRSIYVSETNDFVRLRVIFLDLFVLPRYPNAIESLCIETRQECTKRAMVRLMGWRGKIELGTGLAGDRLM